MPTSIISIQPHAIRGGPALQHIDFLRELSVHDIQAHVVLPVGHELEDAYRKVATSIIPMDGLATVPRTKSPAALARFMRASMQTAIKIAEHARAVEASVIHTFNEAAPCGPWAAREAKLPSAIHVIGMSVFEPPLVGFAYSQFLRLGASAIICCQEAIRTKLRRALIPERQLHVIYNSVNVDSVRAAAFAHALDPRPDQIRIGMVAGMDRRKGHILFARAAARVCRELPTAHFYVVGNLAGDDAYLSEIRSELQRGSIEQRFHLVGPVASSAAWMRSFDLYCIPSLSEALSVAGIEAMCLERAIVATRVGGNSEAVIDGETGRLCAAQDPDALARAILELLGSDERRVAMGEAGYRRARELFALKDNGARLARLLKALASQSNTVTHQQRRANSG